MFNQKNRNTAVAELGEITCEEFHQVLQILTEAASASPGFKVSIKLTTASGTQKCSSQTEYQNVASENMTRKQKPSCPFSHSKLQLSYRHFIFIIFLKWHKMNDALEGNYFALGNYEVEWHLGKSKIVTFATPPNYTKNGLFLQPVPMTMFARFHFFQWNWQMFALQLMWKHFPSSLYVKGFALCIKYNKMSGI